jgi:hypothetical protein
MMGRFTVVHPSVRLATGVCIDPIASEPTASTTAASAAPATAVESFLASTGIFSLEVYRQQRARMVAGWSDEAFLISYVLPVMTAGSIDVFLSKWQAAIGNDTTTQSRLAKLRTTWSDVCETPERFCRERLFPMLLRCELPTMATAPATHSLDAIRAQMKVTEETVRESKKRCTERPPPTTRSEAIAYAQATQADLMQCQAAVEALRAELAKAKQMPDVDCARLDAFCEKLAATQQLLPQLPSFCIDASTEPAARLT